MRFNIHHLGVIGNFCGYKINRTFLGIYPPDPYGSELERIGPGDFPGRKYTPEPGGVFLRRGLIGFGLPGLRMPPEYQQMAEQIAVFQSPGKCRIELNHCSCGFVDYPADGTDRKRTHLFFP